MIDIDITPVLGEFALSTKPDLTRFGFENTIHLSFRPNRSLELSDGTEHVKQQASAIGRSFCVPISC